MTVKELIEKLENIEDKNMDIMFYDKNAKANKIKNITVGYHTKSNKKVIYLE